MFRLMTDPMYSKTERAVVALLTVGGAVGCAVLLQPIWVALWPFEAVEPVTPRRGLQELASRIQGYVLMNDGAFPPDLAALAAQEPLGECGNGWRGLGSLEESVVGPVGDGGGDFWLHPSPVSDERGWYWTHPGSALEWWETIVAYDRASYAYTDGVWIVYGGLVVDVVPHWYFLELVLKHEGVDFAIPGRRLR